ncbi:MAG: threonine--tRNA ligase [Planctomycetota bacterium]|jgi:threonyl-tRNA synthetase
MATLEFTLPDGRQISAEPDENGVITAAAVLQAGGLRDKQTVAATLDGEVVDLVTALRTGGAIDRVQRNTDQGLEVVRHTAAHVMAQAVSRLFDDVEFAIGPVIENGFYYDFDTPHIFTPEDLEKIEKEMNKIVSSDFALERFEAPNKQAALDELGKQKAKFKTELVESFEDDAVVSFYTQGEFTDLCRGPHLPSTGKVGTGFKLLSIAGAYWRGDSEREQLQRIYATAFATPKELKRHLKQREEAEKRDHRRLGTQLGLFSILPVAPGMPLWHPNGTRLYNTLTDFIREKLWERNYIEIRTPMIMSSELWKRSGHDSHFRENMYFTEVDEREFAVKPMNCPGSALFFEAGLHSYRELPMRVAEMGFCHRNEQSGVIHGLTRVREFTQDDAHIYCTAEQLEAELFDLIDMVGEVYGAFGFDNLRMDFSTRPTNSGGTDEQWANAEAAIDGALKKLGREYHVAPGEGAFYGPKIDFHVFDAIGRGWQVATIQVDFQIAEKFDLNYVGSDGNRHRPVVVHRAIYGSFERFIGILIEHFGGAFPTWLAPEQVRVIPIADDKHGDYSREVVAAARALGLNATADLGSERMKAKIRNAQLLKIPYMLVVGDREQEERTVAVRRRDGVDAKAWPLQEALEAIAAEARARTNAFSIEPRES